MAQEFDCKGGVRTDLRILIVEDELFARDALAALLSAKGYCTSVASSAEVAIDKLNSGCHPEVALVDLDLPGMSGAEFIGRLTHDKPGVLPILISAAENERISKVLNSSVTRLRKPLDFDALLNILNQYQRGQVS